MKSLYERTIPENNFTIISREKPLPISRGEEKFELLQRHNATQSHAKFLKGFKLDRNIQVEYKPDSGRRGSSTREFSLDTKRSSFTSNSETGIFFIDSNGNLLNPISIKVSGEWINDRFAESLPFNYEVNDS